MKEVLSKNNRSLKKHVSMIHCFNKLTLLERKISNVLLFHAFPNLQTQDTHKISVRELCNYLDYKGFNYEAIKTAVKSLISTVIEWNVIDDRLLGKTGEEDWTASSILASVNIRNSVCSYAYSPHMRELISFPSVYGSVNLSIQTKFTSSYGLSLYENCARYRKLGKTKTFPLNVFRKIMGVSEEQYTSFCDFKKRVINKATEEVNKLTDLFVVPNLNKEGRKIVSIYFDIIEQKKNDIFEEGATYSRKPQRASAFRKKISETYLIDEAVVEGLINEHGSEKIKRKIKQIDEAGLNVSGKISNPTGYLIDSLKKDYVPYKSKKEIIKEKLKIRDEKYFVAVKEEGDKEAKTREYERYLDCVWDDFIENMPEDILANIEKEFQRKIEQERNFIALSAFRKNKFNSKITKVFFRKFMDQLETKEKPNPLTFEEFQKKQQQ